MSFQIWYGHLLAVVGCVFILLSVVAMCRAIKARQFYERRSDILNGQIQPYFALRRAVEDAKREAQVTEAAVVLGELIATNNRLFSADPTSKEQEWTG